MQRVMDSSVLDKQHVSMFLRFNIFNDAGLDENNALFDFYLAM